jgi:hypothetical protein
MRDPIKRSGMPEPEAFAFHRSKVWRASKAALFQHGRSIQLAILELNGRERGLQCQKNDRFPDDRGPCMLGPSKRLQSCRKTALAIQASAKRDPQKSKARMMQGPVWGLAQPKPAIPLTARLRQVGSPSCAEPDVRLRAHSGHSLASRGVFKADLTSR